MPLKFKKHAHECTHTHTQTHTQIPDIVKDVGNGNSIKVLIKI